MFTLKSSSSILCTVFCLGLLPRLNAQEPLIPAYPEPKVSWIEKADPTKTEKHAFVPNPVFNGFAKTRVVEKFPRGVEAVPTQKNGVYVSWRLLKEDPKGIAFNVFRVRDGKETKLNAAPIVQTTDFIDAEGKLGDRYIVRPAAGHALAGEATTENWKLDSNGSAYLSIKLNDPAATVQKVGLADLNGDGVYDFVVKTPNTNIDPWDRVWKPSTETYKISGYLADGTYLWTHDMGWGIECGMWYSPFITYDFNGDGKAEVVVKEAEDKRDKDGRVYAGEEYLVVLDGMTGKEIARAPWPTREGFENYDMASRNQVSMGYLDGKTPCIVALRGTYGTMKAEAWQLKGGKLESCWKFSNYHTQYDENNRKSAGCLRSGSTPMYYGQGAHFSIAADINDDGRDELILGSFALNGNGDMLWSSGKGHPDWMILTDIIAENPGQEIAYIYETPQPSQGVCMLDAKTGKILWGNNDASKHIHTGHAANFDPTLSGPEVLGIDHNGHMPIDGKYWRFNNKGDLLSSTRPESGSALKGVYWDADLEKEVLAATITDYKGGAISKIQGSIVMTADLFGDWREEIVTSLPGELRVYSTTIPAMDRRPCLMQEHSYRMNVAINSQAYYYDPNLPYMPTFESNNFSLIFKPKTPGTENPNICQVTVSASKHAPLAGTVTMQAPTGLSVDPISWKVDLKPGEIAVKEVRISGKIDGKVVLHGSLEESKTGVVLRGQVPVYEIVPKFKVPAGAIRVPAANFTKSEGGSATVANGRPLAPEGCLIGWDNVGHIITWEVEVPKDGNYRLLAQAATNVNCHRRLTVNDQLVGDFPFEKTGGKGYNVEEWVLRTFKKDGNPVVLSLHAGKNTIVMENTDNNMLNFAYLFLEPAE